MSEQRYECYKCLNNQNCLGGAEYGSLYCMINRKYKVQDEDDSVYAHKFATMQKQIDEKDKRIQELEAEKKKYIVNLTDEQYRNLVDAIKKEVKQEFEQKVKDLKESVILDNTIVGGRRNCKTLEYGIKLGKIKACEELLKENK